jgi:hypothetical protein
MNEGATFRQLLEQAESLDRNAWLYLPEAEAWQLDSPTAVLRSEEVPPELEDDPTAGVPQSARDAGLMRALPIAVLQEIIHNAHAQKPTVDVATLFEAFLYYYDNDAFLPLK